tara:strand:+ start:2646 stop:3125 length:480 start_codon:yes stop_codon:yes gene_type:complete
MIKVIDNFLPEIFFNFFKEQILNRDFPWYHQNSKVSDNDNEEQFTHLFYSKSKKQSDKVELIKPILKQLFVKEVIKAKLNLTLKEDIIRPFEYHTDIDYTKCNTAILYINTNNGKTLFKDKGDVESIENRLVIFPSDLLHTGTTHTDKKYRIVLNINYK